MMRRGIKKVEMVDAWTQTSNRGSDTEETKKNRRSQQQQQYPPGQHYHHRTQSNPNGSFVFSDATKKPRSSVEHIYQHAPDPKQIQL